MKLTHPKFEYQFNFAEDKVYELVVENKKLFEVLALGIAAQSDGGEGDYCLFEHIKELTFSTSVFVVSDLLRLDVNNRRILTKLYESLKQDIDTAHALEFSKIRDDIFSLFEEIAEEERDTLIFDEVTSVVDIMKLVNLRFNQQDASILESLTEYVRCTFEYLKTKLFCVVNLRSYLSEEEYAEFVKYCIYNEYTVLLLESTTTTSQHLHKRIVIDEDLCEIY